MTSKDDERTLLVLPAGRFRSSNRSFPMSLEGPAAGSSSESRTTITSESYPRFSSSMIRMDAAVFTGLVREGGFLRLTLAIPFRLFVGILSSSDRSSSIVMTFLLALPMANSELGSEACVSLMLDKASEPSESESDAGRAARMFPFDLACRGERD